MTTGLVVAALIIGAALIMRIETDAKLFGYPTVAIVCSWPRPPPGCGWSSPASSTTSPKGPPGTSLPEVSAPPGRRGPVGRWAAAPAISRETPWIDHDPWFPTGGNGQTYQ